METSEKFRTLVAVCVLLAAVTATAPGRIIYVDDDAPGVCNGSFNDGSSWDSAFIYLQQALIVAQADDEVRVAQGLYRPDQGLPARTMPSRSVHATGVLSVEGAPSAAFSLKNGVTLMGGFAGLGAENPNARDPEQYGTILSGDLRGNDIDLWGPGSLIYESFRADNSLHVVESIDVDATGVLDGFVIESAVDSGLFNRGGSPNIVNCVFQDNASPEVGGGLRCEGGQPTLSNCLFQGNHSTNGNGGALYVTGVQIILSDCRFVSNSAGQEGGGLCAISSDLSLTGCTFEANGARREGGAIREAGGTLTLVECTFERNVAYDGGALSLAVESASVTGCVFRSNWACMYGGAVENAESLLTLDQCVLSGNTAVQGGAVYAFRSTAPRTASTCVASLTRCLVTGNRASSSGALCSNKVEFAILGCTFADNQASIADTLGWSPLRPGEAFYRLRMENCIVWDRSGSIAPSTDGYRSPPAYEERQPDVTVRYCDMEAAWPGEGNIATNPCFAAPGHWVDAANPKITVYASHANAAWVEGDYHLKSQAGRWDPNTQSWVLDEVTSPCIDAGDPNSSVGEEPEPNGGRVNMGAYGGTAEASKSYLNKP
jgi:predicted outer membrane repeat protein